jgi:hypothetical protein
VAFIAAACLFATFSASAVAGSHYYCGAPNYVEAGTACYSGEAHTYGYNYAEYLGSGSFSFCEWLEYGSITYSQNCVTPSQNYFVYGYSSDRGHASYPNTNTFMHDDIFHTDNNRHTMTGYSEW